LGDPIELNEISNYFIYLFTDNARKSLSDDFHDIRLRCKSIVSREVLDLIIFDNEFIF